jgi:cupin superfamily acireductone dioxygenase involved in methionine salvage
LTLVFYDWCLFFCGRQFYEIKKEEEEKFRILIESGALIKLCLGIKQFLTEISFNNTKPYLIQAKLFALLSLFF